MIALALLILIGLYLCLFVIAGFRTRSWSRRFIWWGALLAPFVWLTWDMPVGYYRFNAMCEKEGGVKVYEEKPAQAKVLRLDVDGMRWAGGGLLINYPTLDAIEAGDEKHANATPPAYARYERDPHKPARTSFDKKIAHDPIISRLIDRVEQRPNGYFTVERGASQADYVLGETHWEEPIRMNLRRFTLRHADGRVVATSTRIGYSWTNSNNTLLGRTRGYKPPLALIAQPKPN
jgi:hypothetical protein